MTLGQKVRYKRRKLHKCSYEIASDLSISPATYSKIENDRFIPNTVLIDRIAAVLNVTPEYLTEA